MSERWSYYKVIAMLQTSMFQSPLEHDCPSPFPIIWDSSQALFGDISKSTVHFESVLNRKLTKQAVAPYDLTSIGGIVSLGCS